MEDFFFKGNFYANAELFFGGGRNLLIDDDKLLDDKFLN